MLFPLRNRLQFRLSSVQGKRTAGTDLRQIGKVCQRRKIGAIGNQLGAVIQIQCEFLCQSQTVCRAQNRASVSLLLLFLDTK